MPNNVTYIINYYFIVFAMKYVVIYATSAKSECLLHAALGTTRQVQ
jgi:hypothetical protein